MRKFLLLIAIILGLLSERAYEYAMTQASRSLQPASPKAERLMKSMQEDADWHRVGDGIYNRKIGVRVDTGLATANVTRMSDGAVIPCFVKDDLTHINRLFSTARQLACDRELATFIDNLDKPDPKAKTQTNVASND